MKLTTLFSILFLCLLLFSPVLAKETYSYDNAERLTPLINWQEYGPEAFTASISENKPIFLLLTAPSWCYWCQVYESEDYLFHPAVVKLINEKFIPVYVNADKRKDVTRQYLEGGWPSTTVFAPNRERLFGFSGIRPVPNMLANLHEAVTYVQNNGFVTEFSYNYTKVPEVIPTINQLRHVEQNYFSYIFQAYDSVYGGFGTGQKFPQTRALLFLLETYDRTNNPQVLQPVETTLLNQYTKIDEVATNYKLFDPVAGGFHRYGTTRTWSPPHYEKMLYDNARLLRTYAYLVKLNPDNALAKEVVEKTDQYIQKRYYDEKTGGFFANTDVHGEDAYYGKNPREGPLPRVEETKYSDWNAEAVLTYLSLYASTGNTTYETIARNTLNFLADELITTQGAYHYRSPDGERGVQGSLTDNAYLLLAFTQGYEVLGDKTYLDTARQLASYSLDTLYDWNSGGFFERHSQETELYAFGDHILLSKPSEENGIMVYALLRLYQQTEEPLYLVTAIKTLGNELQQIGGLDGAYYYVKASQLIIAQDLLTPFAEAQTLVAAQEVEQQKSFWLDDLLTPKTVSPSFIATDEGITMITGSLLVLLLIAFVAGFLSFASPCSLPILPAYVAYSFKSSRKNIVGMTLSFFVGLSAVFVALGMSATFFGNFLKEHLIIFSQVAGLVILLFGIFMLLGKSFPGLSIKQTKPRSYLGSALFGAILGISWTPCVGPILLAILLMASTASSVATGGVLLFAYALGLALPLLFLSTYLGKLHKKSFFWKLLQGKEVQFTIAKKLFRVHTTTLISGILFIVLGYLIFSGTLYSFNQYIAASPLQNWIFAIEEKLLSFAH